MTMDSKRCVYLLFVFLLAVFSNARSTPLADPSSERVSVGLYYETLCSDSAIFIAYYLNKLVEDDGMMEIVDLRLVPYGNAEIKNGSIYCQHGEYECAFNTLQACAIDAAPSVKKHFPFIHCQEKLFVETGEFAGWDECFDVLPEADPNSIIECTTGLRGLELEFKYAEETESLQPPHEFVPWVTINGVPLKEEEIENFITHICEAYKGPNVPKTCSSVSLKSTRTEGRKAELKGCGRKEIPKRLVTNIKPAIPWHIKN